MPRQRSIQVSIPQPCAQSWQDMQMAGNGRFCSQCQTTVVDFTSMTDDAVMRHIRQYGLSCGRFRDDQLEREIVSVELEKRRWRKWLVAGVAAVFSFGVKDADAKTSQAFKVMPCASSDDTSKLNKEIIGYVIVSGRLSDRQDVGLADALVRIVGMPVTAVTDTDGNYKLLVPVFDTLDQVVTVDFVYQGTTRRYEDVRIGMTKACVLNAKVAIQTGVAMGGGIFTSDPYLVDGRKKTFWQKLQFWKRHR